MGPYTATQHGDTWKVWRDREYLVTIFSVSGARNARTAAEDYRDWCNKQWEENQGAGVTGHP